MDATWLVSTSNRFPLHQIIQNDQTIDNDKKKMEEEEEDKLNEKNIPEKYLPDRFHTRTSFFLTHKFCK